MTTPPAHDVVHGIPDDDWTLGEVREWMRLRVEIGTACPACTQFAKVYRRRLNRTMARGLVTLYHNAGMTFSHTPSLVRSHEFAQLSWWELIEENSAVVDEGRSGFWRVTEKGRAWLTEEITVPEYARIYDQRLLGLSGDEIGVREALTDRYSLEDLLAGT